MKKQLINKGNNSKLFTVRDLNFAIYKSNQKLLNIKFVDNPYLNKKYKNPA